MKNRIRQVLREALILESPLFRSVAIRYKGKVYEGEPWMYHANLVDEVLGEDAYADYENGFGIEGLEDGYVTLDGKFVDRQGAQEMVGEWESGDLKQIGALDPYNPYEN